MKPTPKSQPESAVLLAFGAHPDDIEFGCGGVIARETQEGSAAHLVVCSRGESGTHGTPAQRAAESKRAAKLLGATLEFASLGGDAHIGACVAGSLKLAAIIRRVRPSVVLAPTTTENQHPDHVAVGRMVRDAARLARYGGVKELKKQPPHAVGQLLFYSVTGEPAPTDHRPTVWIDVSGVGTAWHDAMQAHASQMRTRNYAELQLARARLHGLRFGVELAIPLFPNDPLIFDSLKQLGRAARRY